ncbi:hypothetical protein MKX17_15685, partial [Acinetobacter ursingii]|nr:hypothetical protein [Acinetobacter ursingii]
MYDQNNITPRGRSCTGRVESDFGAIDEHGTASLPLIKLVTDGRGNIRPLGIYTDNSANRTTQGFQTIREKFKLLHFARKLLPKERTAHCFYNRIAKEEGVSVFLNKLRNKANYGNVMRCANPWACPVCSAI